VLNVSPSSFYAWRDRSPSIRAVEDAMLTEHTRQIYVASDGNYSSPNIHAELRVEGTRVGGKRVARLMRPAQILGVSRRRGLVVTTRWDSTHRKVPDLVSQTSCADGPNQLSVADMTYVTTQVGSMYLAIVLDAWIWRMGWAIGEQRTGDLVLATLNIAYHRCRPRAVIHHSDPGSIHERRVRPTRREARRATVDGRCRRRLR
jgi:putative transposase